MASRVRRIPRLYLDSFATSTQPDFTSITTTLKIAALKTGKQLGTLSSQRREYPNGENTSEAGLYVTLRGDLYVVFTSLTEDGKAGYFKIVYNPLQIWLWIGVIIMIVGMVSLYIPTMKKRGM